MFMIRSKNAAEAGCASCAAAAQPVDCLASCRCCADSRQYICDCPKSRLLLASIPKARVQTNLFTIPPGAPFLETFATAFLEGRVVKGFSRALGPLALADAAIYVPTRRAARALIAEFSRALGGRATLLPRILPLGALEETETRVIFADAAGDDFGGPLDQPVAISETARRMQLAALILDWARRLRHAIVNVDSSGDYVVDAREPLVVAMCLGESSIPWRCRSSTTIGASRSIFSISPLRVGQRFWPRVGWLTERRGRRR
jgi:hypothetical protein